MVLGLFPPLSLSTVPFARLWTDLVALPGGVPLIAVQVAFPKCGLWEKEEHIVPCLSRGPDK
jgi:hypothetical protein